MRLLFITAGIISDALLLFFIYLLSKNKSPLRISLLKIFVTAFIAVSANIVIAAAITETITNVAFTVYFSSLDFITYYLLMFAFTYTGRLQSLKEFVEFWRIAIIVDILNLTASILSGHMYTIYPLTLSDGSIAYQTTPTPLYNVHLLLCYLPIIFTLVLLTISLSKSHSFYRFKYFPILMSLYVVIILNVAYMMFSLPFDWSVLFYALTGFMLFFFSLYYIPRQLMNNTLSLAVDSMKEGLFLFDAERNCIYVNKTAHDNFDISGDSLNFDQYPISLWLEGRDKEHLESFREIYPMTIKGNDLKIKVDYRLCTDSKNNDLGAFFLIEDVTADQNLMKNLEDARTEANQANAAKSIFLANMSHEIRTPINTIMGMNEMILRENADDVPAEYRDSVTGYANNIKVASETLLGLINNLLDLSKIESGKMELVEHDYDMQELLQSIVMMIRVRSNQKDLTFQTEIDQKLPIKLYGDYGKLKEVLLNLLTNAVKYTKEGGFTLSVQTKEISPDNCRISFAVTDTGIGIKPEDMDKLFTAFKRFEQVKNSGIQGTGLGLDISRQYVELMGGALKCESVYGQGSTFSFEIEQRIIDATPIGEFKVSDSKTVAEDYAPDFIAPEGRILVVDDNEMNLQVIKGLLKHSKLQLTLVTGGRECLEKLEEGSYHVVLLDHMMPGMDGIETLGHIREKYPDQVVIALTANVMNGGATFYKDAGFQDYLSKPVDAAQLENTLREYLPKELLIESQPGQDREDEQKMELPEDMKWLEDVDGLNVEEGIRYCGMPGQLLKFLHTFYDTLDAKAGEIEEAFRNKDIKFYTIKVHALKSTARIMGADKLSKLAEDLEKAGNENNLARIEADTGKLLEMYRAYKDKLIHLKEEDSKDDRPEISGEDLDHAYQAIREFAPQMDYDAVEMVIEELKEYKIPEGDKQKVDKLEKLLKAFDWDGIQEMLG